MILVLFAMMLSPLALAGGKKPAAGAQGNAENQPDASAVDISGVKKDLLVLSDGKQHYIAVIPFGDFYSHFYYGVYAGQRLGAPCDDLL